jgi:hypothetical protein
MALTSNSSRFRLAGDAQHIVEARIQTCGLTIGLNISADGQVQVQAKSTALEALWRD